MHCVYMGSQELPELLAGHESVGLTPTLCDFDLDPDPISPAHSEAIRADSASACQLSGPGEVCVCASWRDVFTQTLREIIGSWSQTTPSTIRLHEAINPMLIGEQTAYPRRRGPDIQGAYYSPQGPPGRPSHCSQRGTIKHQLA
jgi:hypothetical protein